MVVVLVGVLVTSALGSLVFLVEKLRGVRDDYGAERKASSALESVFQDLRSGLPGGTSPFRLVHRDALAGGADDALLIWSLGPTHRGGGLGTVVYAVIRQDLLHPVATGLYRWDLKSKRPADVDLERLRHEDARMVLPGVGSLRAEAFRQGGWVQETVGDLPEGVRLAVTRWGRRTALQDWLPFEDTSKP